MKSWPGALSPAVSDFSATGALDLDLRPKQSTRFGLGFGRIVESLVQIGRSRDGGSFLVGQCAPVFTGALGLTFVVEASDLDRDLEEKRQSQARAPTSRTDPTLAWQLQRIRRARRSILDDQAFQTLVRQNAGKVQHDDEQWNFEADAEDEQQIDDEAEVLRTTERGDLDVVTDGQEEVQSLRHDEVRQDCAENEESGTCGDESDRVATLFGVEARGDECPQLVKPHRAGKERCRR